MRTQHARLLSMPDIVRIDRDLGPIMAEETVRGRPPAERVAAVATIPKPDELTWWDWTVFLLHTAAEIEHALMVQYLYAAYSLAEDGFQGPAVPAGASELVGTWRQTIVGIAKEEMAHLLTVQNLLRFIGGPLNLEREDFPFRAFLYPFPLQLEPLTRTSLAKYVAAEMPATPPQPPELIQEIRDRATAATGGLAINRVGVMYDTLISIFEDETKLAASDLRPKTAEDFQAAPTDWRARDPLLVRVVHTREEAVAALRAVGEQGEGSANPPPGAAPSHFDRFIGIWTAFPETEGAAGSGTWTPTRPVPSNPNTLPHPSADAALERGRITHPTTRLWAQLFNTRYRMLLVDLAHALHLPGPMTAAGTTTVKGNVRNWTFQEMTGRPRAGLRGIAKALATMPLKATSAPADPANAGPPFELPYTLALPDNERDRWRLHLALLETSRELIGRIQTVSGTNAILDELVATDLKAKKVVEDQLALP